MKRRLCLLALILSVACVASAEFLFTSKQEATYIELSVQNRNPPSYQTIFDRTVTMSSQVGSYTINVSCQLYATFDGIDVNGVELFLHGTANGVKFIDNARTVDSNLVERPSSIFLQGESAVSYGAGQPVRVILEAAAYNRLSVGQSAVLLQKVGDFEIPDESQAYVKIALGLAPQSPAAASSPNPPSTWSQ